MIEHLKSTSAYYRHSQIRYSRQLRRILWRALRRREGEERKRVLSAAAILLTRAHSPRFRAYALCQLVESLLPASAPLESSMLQISLLFSPLSILYFSLSPLFLAIFVMRRIWKLQAKDRCMAIGPAYTLCTCQGFSHEDMAFFLFCGHVVTVRQGFLGSCRDYRPIRPSASVSAHIRPAAI